MDSYINVINKAAEDYYYQSLAKKILSAKWTRKQINNFEDSAFAIILPGGKKDDQGKTVSRSLRKLPHHNMSGDLGEGFSNKNIDKNHLRNALARVSQMDATTKQIKSAKNHLERHAKDVLEN